MIRRPPRSTLFPTRRSSDLVSTMISSRPPTRSTCPSCRKRRSLICNPRGISPIKLLRFLQDGRSEEHTSELQSRPHLVCRLLLGKKQNKIVLTRENHIQVVT